MIDFQECAFKIEGHIGLGPKPSLECGTWNGKSLGEMGEEELQGVVKRIIALTVAKFQTGAN